MSDPRLRRHALGYVEVVDKPSPAELRAYYAERYYQSNQGNYRVAYGPQERRYIEAKVNQKAHIVRKLRGDAAGSLLDVGCGEGFAMSFFRRDGWRVEGLDYSSAGLIAMNPECADALTTGDVTSLLQERITGAREYDVIWLNNVLEHVVDPPELMTQLHRLLADGGVVVVTVPNDFSRYQQHLLETAQVDAPFWVALPDHLAYFTADSLTAIGEATGYNCRHLVADFPIDWFLLHPGSNYARDRSRGPAAHEARIQLENLLAERPVDDVNGLFEAMAKVGLGRQITAFFTRSSLR